MSHRRNPSLSPASTAGRVRMILPTSRSASADTASAIAIGLSRPGRTDPKGDRAAPDRVDVMLLVDRLGICLPAVAPDDVLEDVADVRRVLEGAENGIDRARADHVAALDELDELTDHGSGTFDLISVALEREPISRSRIEHPNRSRSRVCRRRCSRARPRPRWVPRTSCNERSLRRAEATTSASAIAVSTVPPP